MPSDLKYLYYYTNDRGPILNSSRQTKVGTEYVYEGDSSPSLLLTLPPCFSL